MKEERPYHSCWMNVATSMGQLKTDDQFIYLMTFSCVCALYHQYINIHVKQLFLQYFNVSHANYMLYYVLCTKLFSVCDKPTI